MSVWGSATITGEPHHNHLYLEVNDISYLDHLITILDPKSRTRSSPNSQLLMIYGENVD